MLSSQLCARLPHMRALRVTHVGLRSTRHSTRYALHVPMASFVHIGLTCWGMHDRLHALVVTSMLDNGKLSLRCTLGPSLTASSMLSRKGSGRCMCRMSWPGSFPFIAALVSGRSNLQGICACKQLHRCCLICRAVRLYTLLDPDGSGCMKAISGHGWEGDRKQLTIL